MSRRKDDLEAIVVRLSELEEGRPNFRDDLYKLIDDAKLELNRERRGLGIEKAREVAVKLRSEKVFKRIESVYPFILQARREGQTTHTQIAAWLNAKGIPAPGGESWTRFSVLRNEDKGGKILAKNNPAPPI